MSVAHINGVDLYYEIHGEGFPLVLAHGYCTSINLWQHQIPMLSQRYRVIAYDHRDHGQSSKASAPYTIDDLSQDAVAIIEHEDAWYSVYAHLESFAVDANRKVNQHQVLEQRSSSAMVRFSSTDEPFRDADAPSSSIRCGF